MIRTPKPDEAEAVERALLLAEAALAECDQHGLVFAAIDLCSAIEKLRTLIDVPGNRSQAEVGEDF